MQNMVDIMYISTPLPVEFCAKFQNVQYFSSKLPARPKMPCMIFYYLPVQIKFEARQICPIAADVT